MKSRVLIADDNIDFAELLKDALSQHKEFEVVATANSGILALELVQNLQPDILLLDMALSYLDGLEILNRLKALETKLPKVFIISAMSNNAIIYEALRLGADAYYTRPINIAQTIDHILYYMKVHSND